MKLKTGVYFAMRALEAEKIYLYKNMGTNYELRRNICPTCSHSRDTLHIGKSSCGWTFTFQGHENPPIRSAEEWRLEMKKGGEIFDGKSDAGEMEAVKVTTSIMPFIKFSPSIV